MLGTTLGMIASGGGGDFNPLDFSVWSNSLWTWVIFLLSVYPMYRFVFGPIVRALDKRDGEARQAIADAQAARDDSVRIKAEIEERLAQVKGEEAGLLAEARSKAEALGREIQEKAKVEGERQLDRARIAIDQEKTRALTEIRGEVVELTIMAAGKVVGRVVSDTDHQGFIQDLIQGAGPEKAN